ncbi:MAG TPA: hypothetical protein VN892_11750 [Solirubrobacteraceae bacterium]|nr:hypothetical protein [Solirubrobacteraceae bacterium]
MAEVITGRSAVVTGFSRVLLHVLATFAEPNNADLTERVAVVVELSSARVDVDQADGSIDHLVDYDLVAGSELGDCHPQVTLHRTLRRPRPSIDRTAGKEIARLCRKAEHRQNPKLGETFRQIRVLMLHSGDAVDLAD